MRTMNVWDNNQERVDEDLLRGIYGEDYAEQDNISVYEAAFLEAYDD